jgi:transposase
MARTLWDAIQYIASTGCQWAQLPKDFPPSQRCSTMRDGGLLDVINAVLVARMRRMNGSRRQQAAEQLHKQQRLVRSGYLSKGPERTKRPVRPGYLSKGPERTKRPVDSALRRTPLTESQNSTAPGIFPCLLFGTNPFEQMPLLIDSERHCDAIKQ